MSSTFSKDSNSSSSKFRLLPISVNCVFWYITFGGGGGADSEVSNRVYMIAPVKKFCRVRLSTIFSSKQIWRRMLGFWVFPRPNIQKRFSRTFLMEFWTSEGVMYEQSMGDYTYRDSASRQVQLYISFVNFRASSLVSISYIFPPTVVLRTLSLILNICYELTII